MSILLKSMKSIHHGLFAECAVTGSEYNFYLHWLHRFMDIFSLKLWQRMISSYHFSVFLNEISDLLQKSGHIWSLGRSVLTAAGARCAVVLRSLHNFVCSRTIKDLGVAERRMWKWDPGGPHPANTLRALFTLTLHLFSVLLRCHVSFPGFVSPLSAPAFSFCLAKMLPDSCFDISLFPPSHSFLSRTDDVLGFSSHFVLSFSVNGLTELFQGEEPWPLHPCCSQSMLRLPRPLSDNKVLLTLRRLIPGSSGCLSSRGASEIPNVRVKWARYVIRAGLCLIPSHVRRLWLGHLQRARFQTSKLEHTKTGFLFQGFIADFLKSSCQTSACDAKPVAKTVRLPPK